MLDNNKDNFWSWNLLLFRSGIILYWQPCN